MFVATRWPNWSPTQGSLQVTATIEEMEQWVQSYMEEEPDGNKMYVYKVDITPVMEYVAVHEIRGDSWDGLAE